MKRRALLAGMIAAGLLVAPLGGETQIPQKVYRIGFLSTAASAGTLREALRALGYVEGRNLVLEVRLAEGQFDRLPALAAELVAARVELIAAASPPAIKAAQEATTTIPIVMAFTSMDPVRSGFVKSLARPGGNITGVAIIADELVGKRLEKLKEVLPRATRIAVLAQAQHSVSTGQVEAARKSAAALGVELDVFEVRGAEDYESALSAAARRAPGLFIVANPMFAGDARLLATLAVKHRLAAVCEWREMAEAGCLMSYGPELVDLGHRTASFVDRILRGARPADLPVEQPTKFALTFNLNTAKALGLTIPKELRQQADVVP